MTSVRSRVQDGLWAGLALLAAFGCSSGSSPGADAAAIAEGGSDAQAADAATDTSAPDAAAVNAQTFVGALDGADALIALVVDGDSVVAYTCGRGAALDTHTGWFFTELTDPGAMRPLRPAQSAGGLTLTGSISADEAQGSLQLVGGATVAFHAVPARAPAGLYEDDGAEALTGLIVDNDGQTAGNIRFAPAVTTAPISAPVLVTSTSLATPLTGAVVTVPSSPTLTSTTSLTLTPVTAPTTIRRNGPVLLIMSHGMSHFIDTPAAVRDTPAYSRDEWGTDVVRGLLGAGETDQIALFNFRGDNVSGSNFINPDLLPKYDENMADANIPGDPSLPAHFISPIPPGASTPPPVTLFITYRNSLDGLVGSGKRIANQAYVALKFYEARFKVTPAVILVGHSFGNLANRFVLSNPTMASLTAPPGAPPFNADNIVISDRDRARMDYLRDRTLYTVSLGGPHEGSPMADVNIPIQMLLQMVLQPGATLSGDALGVFQAIDTLDTIGRNTVATEQLLQRTRDGLNAAIQELNSPALRDLRHAFWVAVNQGPLQPAQAIRSAASPIVGAQGALIPIYAIGGRSPGGRIFDTPDLIAGVQRYNVADPKVQTWTTKNMFGGDLVVKALAGGGGQISVGPTAAFAAQLDRRGRISDYRSYVRPLAQNIIGQLPVFTRDFFDAAADKVIDFLMSTPGRSLQTPIHVDRVWILDLSGHVSLPVPALQCTDGSMTFAAVLDLPSLLQLVSMKFGSIHGALNQIATLDINGLITLLAAPATFNSEISQWLLDHAAPLGAASGRCQLPLDVTSVLSAPNILNWKVATVMRDFPAPAWKRTETPISDGEIDSDGVVPFSSAMGFSLGTSTPEFFDHRRNDGPGGRPGSWYRFYDSPIEAESHAMQHQFLTGKFVHDAILAAGAGPVPRTDGLSQFP